MARQSRLVKVSVALTVAMIVAGLVNGVLSTITFKNREPRRVAIYLFVHRSRVSHRDIFALKFTTLLVTNSTSVSTVVADTCVTLDFLWRLALMDQWLSACVAIERAVTIIQGTRRDEQVDE